MWGVKSAGQKFAFNSCSETNTGLALMLHNEFGPCWIRVQESMVCCWSWRVAVANLLHTPARTWLRQIGLA